MMDKQLMQSLNCARDLDKIMMEGEKKGSRGGEARCKSAGCVEVVI